MSRRRKSKQISWADSAPGVEVHPLNDFCEIATADRSTLSTPIRLDGTPPTCQWYEADPVIVHDFPINQTPIPVSQALEEGLLSATSKIHLAFTLSRSFWQFYDSDWMHIDWNLEEAILLLPQRDKPGDLNAEAAVPYLAIKPVPVSVERFREHDIGSQERGGRRMHRHPFILNLCLLLVLLGTKAGRLDDKVHDINSIYGFCIRQVHHDHSEWPMLPAAFRDEYRRIVATCLPNTACREIQRSPEERRQLLEDAIVRPLYSLLVRLRSFDTEELPARFESARERPVKQRRDLDHAEDNLW